MDFAVACGWHHTGPFATFHSSSNPTNQNRERHPEPKALFLWRPNLRDDGDNHVLELAFAVAAITIVPYNLRNFSGELEFLQARVSASTRFLKTIGNRLADGRSNPSHRLRVTPARGKRPWAQDLPRRTVSGWRWRWRRLAVPKCPEGWWRFSRRSVDREHC